MYGTTVVNVVWPFPVLGGNEVGWLLDGTEKGVLEGGGRTPPSVSDKVELGLEGVVLPMMGDIGGGMMPVTADPVVDDCCVRAGQLGTPGGHEVM